MDVESTSKCKITKHVWRIRTLVWKSLIFPSVFRSISFVSTQFSCLYNVQTNPFFGIYCLISLFVFSIAPFCHEQYGSAKYTGTPKNLVMSLCAANSGPVVCCNGLQAVLVWQQTWEDWIMFFNLSIFIIKLFCYISTMHWCDLFCYKEDVDSMFSHLPFW